MQMGHVRKKLNIYEEGDTREKGVKESHKSESVQGNGVTHHVVWL